MTKELFPLKTSNLTYLESGQIIERHLTDIGTLGQTKITDPSLKAYLLRLADKKTGFVAAFGPIQKSDKTDKIAEGDDERDTAYYAIGKAINLYSTSEIAAEREASALLSIVYNSYQNLATLNYEAETLGIDKMLTDLQDAKYTQAIALLNMGRYITRLSAANASFKALFGGRVVEDTAKENFDAKALRKDMFKVYSEFANYVVSQAKAPATENDPQFTDVLALINTGRKYYADIIARREGGKGGSTGGEAPKA